MYILLFLLFTSMYAADSELSVQSPDESPSQIIEDAVLEGLPEALHIVAECLGDQKEAAAVEIVGCVIDPRSPARKLARGGILCCIRACKKKRQ
jgi:hypothetical protein